ncbi:hypothetical protein FRX31_023759, partial [Thalictrum thalictroides]
DLSFNKLDGKIPRGLQNLRFLGLARNNFQGPIPDWVSSVQSKDLIMMDFSHNYFSSGFSPYLNKSYLNFFNCCNAIASTMNSPVQIPYTLIEKCSSMCEFIYFYLFFNDIAPIDKVFVLFAL